LDEVAPKLTEPRQPAPVPAKLDRKIIEKAAKPEPTINIHVGAMMGKTNEAYQFAKITQRQVKRINRRQITV